MDADWCLVCDSKIPFERYDSFASSAFCSPGCLAKAQADARSRSSSPVHPPAQSTHPRSYSNTLAPGRPSRGVGSRRPRLSVASSEDSDRGSALPSIAWAPLVSRGRLAPSTASRRCTPSSDGQEDDSEAPSLSTLDTSLPSDSCALPVPPEYSLNLVVPRGPRSMSKSPVSGNGLGPTNRASVYSTMPSTILPPAEKGERGVRNGFVSATSSPRAASSNYGRINGTQLPSGTRVAAPSSAILLPGASRATVSGPPASRVTAAGQAGLTPVSNLFRSTTSTLPQRLRDSDSRLIESPRSFTQATRSVAGGTIASTRIPTTSVRAAAGQLTVEGLTRAGSAERLAQYLADIGRAPTSSGPLGIPGRASGDKDPLNDVDGGRADDADLEEVAHALYAWGGLISSRTSMPHHTYSQRRTRVSSGMASPPSINNNLYAYDNSDPYVLSSQSSLFRSQRDRQRSPAGRTRASTNPTLSGNADNTELPRLGYTAKTPNGNRTPPLPPTTATYSSVYETRGRRRERDGARARERGGAWGRDRRTDSQEARGNEGDAEEDGDEFERPRGRSTVQRRVSWGYGMR